MHQEKDGMQSVNVELIRWNATPSVMIKSAQI